MSRAAGSTYDVRKVHPYCGYETFEFDVPTFTEGDVFDRYRQRMAEMHQSIRICNQALDRITPTGVLARRRPAHLPPPKDKVYTEMEALIQHFLIHSQGFTVPAGEAFVPVEGPRGEHGVLRRVGRHQPAGARAPAVAVAGGVSGDGADVRRRAHRRRRRHHRLDRHRHGRRGPVSFHPEIPYGTASTVRAAAVAGRRAVRLHARSSARRSRNWRRTTRPSSASRRCSTRSSWCRSSVGYVSAKAMRHVAEVIGCTPAEVEDVATYYAMFYKQPIGKFVIQVCRTLSCALKGAERVTEEIAQPCTSSRASTDESGTFTLLEVECLGACDRAPVVMVNDGWHECQKPEDAVKLLETVRAKGEAGLSGCVHRVEKVDAMEPILTPLVREPDSYTLDFYLQHQGYEGLRKALGMTPDQIVDAVKASGLRGRGGAGFPTGMKWQFVDKKSPKPRYICCNADESEPGTFKDHLLMERNPHLLIEGCAIGCYAIGSSVAYIYIRGEFLHVQHILEAAIAEAYKAGYLGKNILGSGFNCDVYIHRGAGAYEAGEETALIESLEGQAGAAAHQAAVSRRRRLLRLPDRGEQRRDAVQRARRSSRAARSGSRRSDPRRTAGRSCSASAATSSSPASSKRRCTRRCASDLRLRRRHPERAAVEGRDSRRIVGADPAAESDRRAGQLRRPDEGRHRCWDRPA